MGKIVVVGSINTDMVFGSPKIPQPGETVLGKSFSIVQGGKGANQAVAAAKAGSETIFIAKTGNDDFGRNARLEYAKNNISIDHIFIDSQNPTGVAVITVDENTGQNAIVVAPGANNCLSADEILSAENSIKNADILLVQLEIPIETVQQSLLIAKKHGLITILNPAPARELSNSILSFTDIITPNETETKILTGIYPDNEENCKLAAEILLAKVNKAVLITLGSKGVYYLTKEGIENLIPALKVAAVDTTAAGDVFNGYFASSLSDGKSFEEAIVLANKAAAISVTRKGAQTSIPSLQEVTVWNFKN